MHCRTGAVDCMNALCAMEHCGATRAKAIALQGSIWVCVKTPGPPWICGSLLFNRVLNGGIERGVLNGELGGVLNGELGGVLNGGHFLNKHPT